MSGAKTLNEKVVSWHLLEDVLGWAAVLVVAIILKFKQTPYLDPALSLFITAYILFNVVKRLKETLVIFLQGVPDDISIDKIEIALIIFLFVGPFLFPNATIAEMLIFGIVAISTNIMLGYTGMLSFGQALFFGTSAYISGLMLLGGFPLFLAIPVATLGSFIISLFIGYFCVKREGLYFICLTFAFNQMFYFIAYVWHDVTGGEDGLVGVERPTYIDSQLTFYIFTAIMFLFAVIALYKIVTSPLGLIFKLIRENASRAEAIGYNVRFYKLISFSIASTFTGLAGSLYVLIHSMVPIDQIHWLKSGDIIFMTLFGGVGSFLGPLIGVVGYIWLSDTFSIIWARWPLIMGVIFAIVVLYFRGGVSELLENLFKKYKSISRKTEHEQDIKNTKLN